jgi:RNA recognition motif-containing protein
MKDVQLKGSYAFVEYDDERAARKAMAELDNYNLKGSNIRIEESYGRMRERDFGRETSRYPPPPYSHGGSGGSGGSGGGGGYYNEDYYRPKEYYDTRRRSRSPMMPSGRSRSRSRSPYGRRYPLPPPPPPPTRDYRDRDRRDYEGRRRITPPPPSLSAGHSSMNDYYRRDDFREPPIGRRYDDHRGYSRGGGYDHRRSPLPPSSSYFRYGNRDGPYRRDMMMRREEKK